MLARDIITFQEPEFDERWVNGTYIVSGIFSLDGSEINETKLKEDAKILYQEIKQQQKEKWPRGLAAYYIIPIYSALSFEDEVWSRVRKRFQYRWAIWLEPILYRIPENAFTLREDYSLFCSAYHPHLSRLFAYGLNRTAAHFGYDFMPRKITG